MASHRLQILFVFFLIPVGLFYWYTQTRDIPIRDFFLPGTPVVHIGDVAQRVEIANTEEERIRGLSGRSELEGVEGMLFVFPEPGYHSIWMKDMLFPIDIIWIDENLTIIGIDKNISPDSYPRIFRPKRPAQYVIETNIHYADTFGIREGQTIILPQNYLEN